MVINAIVLFPHRCTSIYPNQSQLLLRRVFASKHIIKASD